MAKKKRETSKMKNNLETSTNSPQMQGNATIEKAKDILMSKLNVSEGEAISRIGRLSSLKNLDTEKTCGVIIMLEKIISESWFKHPAA